MMWRLAIHCKFNILITASVNLFGNMSDACETANSTLSIRSNTATTKQKKNQKYEKIDHKNLPMIFVPLDMRKPTFWFPTWSDTNRAVQLQKMARGLKFQI